MCHLLYIINGIRYLALLVFTQAVLSQVTLPCALKRHEALCCPALAILVPVMHQPSGGQDLEVIPNTALRDTQFSDVSDQTQKYFATLL